MGSMNGSIEQTGNGCLKTPTADPTSKREKVKKMMMNGFQVTSIAE